MSDQNAADEFRIAAERISTSAHRRGGHATSANVTSRAPDVASPPSTNSKIALDNFRRRFEIIVALDDALFSAGVWNEKRQRLVLPIHQWFQAIKKRAEAVAQLKDAGAECIRAAGRLTIPDAGQFAVKVTEAIDAVHSGVRVMEQLRIEN